MERKRIPFLALLMLAVILLMPASIQAATKPGTVKLSSIKATDYNKINIKWKKLPELQITSYTTEKPETRSGLK